jgi:hypothetical protein
VLTVYCYLVIVVVEGHFEIETDEFGKMAMGVRVLSAEHRANLEHALEVRANRHLLVELRRLRKIRRACDKRGSAYGWKNIK